MYTKQAISKQKQVFWTAFGRYMKPVLSSDGEPMNWLNYKTGTKHVSFGMDVDSRRAIISVVIDPPTPGIRQAYFDRFMQLKGIWEDTMGEEDWIWQPNATDEHGKAISTIYKELTGVNIFQNEDWPAIISFLKPRIMALDAFWSVVRHQFSNL